MADKNLEILRVFFLRENRSEITKAVRKKQRPVSKFSLQRDEKMLPESVVKREHSDCSNSKDVLAEAYEILTAGCKQIALRYHHMVRQTNIS